MQGPYSVSEDMFMGNSACTKSGLLLLAEEGVIILCNCKMNTERDVKQMFLWGLYYH